MRKLIILFLVQFLLTYQSSAQHKAPINRRVFVTCPFVRDAETMPCWLAEYEGTVYYLGQQGSTSSLFYPPQLKHKVLVEGTLTDQMQCGGVVLADVVISVMPELSLECNTILPAENGLLPPEPLPRAVAPHFADHTSHFDILMDFDSDYLTLHRTRIIDEIDRIAGIRKIKKVKVTVQRSAVLLSNGEVLTEQEYVLSRRANKMKTIFEELGYEVNLTLKNIPLVPNGIDDHLHRKIQIELLN